MSKPIPDIEVLRDRITYDPETGIVKSKRSGKVVKTLATHGYIVIKIQNTLYQLHRVIWKFHTGEDPGELEIDHINGDTGDNRWCNLRLATRTENECNKSGFNVYKRGNKWWGEIKVDKRTVSLSSNACPLLARVELEDKALSIYGRKLSRRIRKRT